MRVLPLILAAACALPAADIGPRPLPRDPDITAAVAMMRNDPATVGLFRAKGLDVLNIAWEDTARWQNSSVGPNISDLTIQVLDRPGFAGCMPVVRKPNFADVTCDVPIDRLQVLVGNQRAAGLEPISLRAYLERFRDYQHAPTGRLHGSLLAGRDQQVLTSAQACFLPVPRGGEARFAPVLFNYQSRPGHPAVLVILATPEGTSAQVIENDTSTSAGVAHGQRLFHNANGQRTALVGRRFSDVQGELAGQGQALPGDQATRDGLSLCMVIQVPLVVEPLRRQVQAEAGAPAPLAAPAAVAEKAVADSETAVVQAGPPEGPWLGLNGRTIRRDERFPIRATVQFYQATSSPTVSSQEVERIAAAIHRVYLDADAVGSLVVGGASGRNTAHAEQSAPWPQPWWEEPCRAWTAANGRPWQEGVAAVRARLGADWQPRDARELANALALLR